MILTDNLSLAGLIGTDSGLPYEVANAIISKVKKDRDTKNIDVEKHWELYQGNHAQYFRQRSNEDNILFKYRKDAAVVANQVRYVVDLSAKYLYGRAGKVSRKFGENKTTDARMRKNVKRAGYNPLMLDAAKKAGVFSELGVRLIPIDEATMEQPVDGIATPTTYPHPITLDPTKTFFMLSKWGKITAVVIQDEYRDFKTGELHKTTELITTDSRWFWDDLQGAGKPTLVVADVNKYKINHEFVLLKNNDSGIDDIQDIINLNIQLDEVLTDSAHFFAKHGWPQLVSSVDLSKVQQHAASHIWNVESEGPQDKIQDKMFFLQWDGRMTEAHEFVQYLEALIFKVSSTARIATGDLEAIGQLRSGPAIVAAHSPSIQKTQEKQVIWEANEQALLIAIAEFDSLIHGQALATRYPDLEISVVFPIDFAPGEELVRAEVQQIQINSHLKTLRNLIEEEHPEFSAEQVDEYRKEIFEDAETMVDSLREFITTADGEKKPKGASGSSAKKSTEQK